jgi:glycine/betaine/sarcosine/D-proline reductase family selenoprotein B
MVKEIERAGFPVVQMCNLIPVATTVGANRIVPTISIPYPLGNPSDSKEQQWKLRYHRVGVALDSLATDIQEQTVFKVKI